VSGLLDSGSRLESGPRPVVDVFVLLLREEVAKTVLDPGDIRAEIHALYKALVTTEGRLER
jgi:hypothetical protein